MTTVKTHVASLMERHGKSNRVHPAILAVRHDMVPALEASDRQ